MDFQQFMTIVPKLMDADLTGNKSHIKMTPFERNAIFETLDLENRNPKIAAVMMLLYPKNNTPHLALIVRNSYEGIHSAQIAFPGGKFETGDKNYCDTALRETQEEIGVHPENMEVIKVFTPIYIQPSNFMVHPFLGICKEEITFIPDPMEVASIIELPLDTLLRDEIIISTTINNSYISNVNLPAFEISNHVVWGATAMILSELKDVLETVIY